MKDLINTVIEGDCLEVMKEMSENSVDSIVTDPPYELGFMGKSWDNTGIANNPYIGIEMTPEYIPIIEARLREVQVSLF